MVTRRNFLISSGLLAASSTAMCRPANALTSPTSKAHSVADLTQAKYLALRSEKLKKHPQHIFLGYPGNRNPLPEKFLNWRKELESVELGRILANNVGDPFRSRSVNHSHFLEADLIERFGGRFGFPKNDVWGIVTNSGTDSNMHGAYIGRTLLHNKTGVQPKIYYTQDAHYSIHIIGHMLALESVVVTSNEDGSMNLTDFAEKLNENKNAPALVLATIGTTFKGAIDDIDAIQSLLKGRESYLHLDAALFGGYLPATQYKEDIQYLKNGIKRYDSIAVSGHKFFGYCSPTGLFVASKGIFEKFKNYFSQVHDPAYIDHFPGTITCSRDAIKPAEFHYFSTDDAFKDQQTDAAMILSNAAYLQKELKMHFPELNPTHIDARSNTVYFDNKIDPKVKKKWVLATVKGTHLYGKSLAHVVVMPHANRALLDQFLSDLDDYRI